MLSIFKGGNKRMKRIESTQNALVKHWKKLVTLRKEREKTKEFIIEGFHLVEEALKVCEVVEVFSLSSPCSF